MALPSTLKSSRLVSGRYPPPGTDQHADRIRERRGSRGITVLDASLLHFPAMAGGYNEMMGAIRSKGRLPGDVRELMILRVAAINNAAFEWIHHEPVGRKEGLTTGQLYIIRDTTTPQPPMKGMLSPLQTIALAFADASTRHIKVPFELAQTFKVELSNWALKKTREDGKEGMAQEVDAQAEDLYVEAAIIVGSYNMVSRFLLATDVGGMSDSEVPWPVDRQEHNISMPSYPNDENTCHTVHAITLQNLQTSSAESDGGAVSASSAWLVFANSLLTDTRMWGWVIPYFLDGGLAYGNQPIKPSETKRRYSILLHSQRGHGASTLPPPSLIGSIDPRQTTIPLLAADIQALLRSPEIKGVIDRNDESSSLNPVHSIIGVSQGGAAALAFAGMYPTPASDSIRTTKSIVACDTAAQTPAGNQAAWVERICLVKGISQIGGELNEDGQGVEYAVRVGMIKLADVTVPRWFPPGSTLGQEGLHVERTMFMKELVSHTSVDGFIAGAQALGDYNLLSTEPNKDLNLNTYLYASRVAHILLLAGSLDGGGKVGKGMENLKNNWITANGLQREQELDHVEIEGAGHLPMVDEPERFCEVVGDWLLKF